MTTISVNVSDAAMPRLKAQAAALGYTDPAEYLLRLMEEDLQYAPKDDVTPTPDDQKRLESILIERIESNDFVEVKEGEFAQLGAEVLARIGRRAQP